MYRALIAEAVVYKILNFNPVFLNFFVPAVHFGTSSKFVAHLDQSADLDNVVEWLERRDCDQHGLGSKPTRHSVVSLEKTLNHTFPCLAVLESSSRIQSYLYKN